MSQHLDMVKPGALSYSVPQYWQPDSQHPPGSYASTILGTLAAAAAAAVAAAAVAF